MGRQMCLPSLFVLRKHAETSSRFCVTRNIPFVLRQYVQKELVNVYVSMHKRNDRDAPFILRQDAKKNAAEALFVFIKYKKTH